VIRSSECTQVSTTTIPRRLASCRYTVVKLVLSCIDRPSGWWAGVCALRTGLGRGTPARPLASGSARISRLFAGRFESVALFPKNLWTPSTPGQTEATSPVQFCMLNTVVAVVWPHSQKNRVLTTPGRICHEIRGCTYNTRAAILTETTTTAITATTATTTAAAGAGAEGRPLVSGAGAEARPLAGAALKVAIVSRKRLEAT
jgi:hypothetical protein